MHATFKPFDIKAVGLENEKPAKLFGLDDFFTLQKLCKHCVMLYQELLFDAISFAEL